MNRFVLLILVGALFVSSALASSTDCPNPGPYSSYIGITCMTGNLTFGGFGYTSSSTGTPIPSSAVTVTPITTTLDEGFQFQPSGMTATTILAGRNETSDIIISYFVTDPFGITGLELTFDGTFTGTGLAGIMESYCLNQTTMAGCPALNMGVISVTNPPTLTSNSVTFGAVTSIAISKDFSVASGTNGSATITMGTNTFTNEVPEPISWMFLGTGLAGLLLLRRRLYKR